VTSFLLGTRRDGVGSSAVRPDGEPKVLGQFNFSSDLHPEGALWGATVRSPHPRADIVSIDISSALAMPGVRCVLTHEDVPGRKTFGLIRADQPVLAFGTVRYQGEPVAIVAADDPERARRAVAAITVSYDVSEPVCDPERALCDASVLVHPAGNLVRHVAIRHGDIDRAFSEADLVVAGEYETGTQDQAFLGPESGLAVPGADGGVDLYVASQHIHADRAQIAACLGLPAEQVRVVLAGVGGAFGGREDVSMHIHACMLALRTGRPVTMMYAREESFLGHVHRHPSKVRVEHAVKRSGKILGVRVRLLLDGGAYTSMSPIVVVNACYFAAGTYAVDNVWIDGYAVYTNNPPNGAMRAFGLVQSCFAVESNMDRVARALRCDPVKLRIQNALEVGTVLPTGQAIDGPAPVRELLELLAKAPLPQAEVGEIDLRRLPGGVGNVTHGEGIRRGVGFALGMKAIGFSGGQDDTSTAQVVVSALGGEPVVEVRTAAAECGQGIVTVQAQIARSELGIDQVAVTQPDTSMADAGSSSASRQTWMTGGAVLGACQEVRRAMLEAAGAMLKRPPESLRLSDGAISEATSGECLLELAELLVDRDFEASYEYHHRRTESIDPETGQGNAHIAFAYAAHRAVVDVDVELGLVRVVELRTAQDVGKAINPLAVTGQIEGGTAQGLGLALMEEIQIVDGKVKNPSFTDYLIPTMLDMPPVVIELLELAHPDSPYGLNGVAELPNTSSTPAIINAVRDATNLELGRAPLRPDDIALAPLAATVVGGEFLLSKEETKT
jgi:xanthine dehydrogenase D subunit